MITFVDKPPPNTSRWGVTTGCFTVDNEATNSPDQVFSAARNGVRRLSEEEVSEVTRLSISAERSLTDLLGAANKTKNSWEKAAKIPGKDPSLTVAIDDGNKSLRDLGNLRIKAFREVDALMVYAQSPKDAMSICNLKLSIWKQYQGAIDEISILAKQAHDSAARYAASISDTINKILVFLQQFMALLQNLISILKDAFSNVVALSGFFARHPQALWAIGGVVGLAALALIFQPYFRALMILRP